MRSSRVLLGIIIAGAVLRLVVWFFCRDLPVRIVDAQDYNGLAVRLLEHGSYVNSHGQPISLRPPLYPAFLAAAYAVFGAENLAAVRAIQGVLGLLIPLCVFQIGRLAFSERAGLLAAAATCFYPSLLGFNFLLLSETLFTLLLFAGTLSVVVAYQRKALRWLLLAGGLLGLGALTRSILWPLTLLLGVYMLLVWPEGLRRRCIAAGALVGALAVTLTPWAYRNTRLHNTLVLVDVMGGRNLMMGNYEHTPLERSWATIHIVRGDRAWNQVLFARHPELRHRLTQGEVDKLAKVYAKQFMWKNPGLTLKRSAVKFFNYWQLERTLVAGAAKGFFGDWPRWSIAAGALVIWAAYAAAMFAGIFGMVLAPPDDRRLHWMFLGLVLAPSLVHALVFGHSRYHLPFMPVVLLYSASALTNSRAIWQSRGRVGFFVAALLFTVLVAAWLRELLMVDMPRVR